MARRKLLIVDDERMTRDVMARLLDQKYETITAPDAEAAIEIANENPDLALVLTDYKMPGMNGIELIAKIKKSNPSTAAILITAFGEISLAVEAMKAGADDFVEKPITDFARFELTVEKAISKHELASKSVRLEKEVENLKSRIAATEGIENITGRSEAMQKVFRLTRQAAKSNATVLIEGPSGTGKELVARALHNLSPRKDGPFVAVECSALPATLLETELFGSIKGAYTDARDRPGCFESADGGTIFLDEIGEIDQAVQVKLLRVLETRTFQRVGETVQRKSDFRLVAATNRNLAKLVAEGKFREDLFYRLNVIDIHMPPLSERPGDIALLVSRFIGEFSKANGSQVTGIDAKAMKALEDYPWPGNVRQLRNAIEKMVVLSGGGKLTIEDVPVEIASHKAAQDSASAIPDGQTLADSEKAIVMAALERERGNVTATAKALGIPRRTLYRRLSSWGVK
ncbi:MAG: sigma-54-dependent Fis family transcriptional regulator [Kiritimatiellae bacterium]|nr:sigma-54-dependent Fis family transcriptional regulator [Kiritimatiellia bacterium]